MPNTDFTWTARLIVTQDGHVDFVHDRQQLEGPNERSDAHARIHFLNTLEAVLPPRMLTQIVKSKLLAREIDTRKEADVVLIDCTHDGEHWVIKGNSKASAGYFYIEARCLGAAS